MSDSSGIGFSPIRQTLFAKRFLVLLAILHSEVKRDRAEIDEILNYVHGNCLVTMDKHDRWKLSNDLQLGVIKKAVPCQIKAKYSLKSVNVTRRRFHLSPESRIVEQID